MVRSAILEMSDYSSRRSMRFSTRSEYGIRVMVRLGRGYGLGPTPLAELAEQEGLPQSYLEQISGQLRRAGLVTSRMGVKGGYTLARRPAAISIADIVIHRCNINGKPLHYHDSAATSQKQAVVIDIMDDYYRRYNANPHRGVYTIGEETTAAYESARQRVVAFINAASGKEVIFTRN